LGGEEKGTRGLWWAIKFKIMGLTEKLFYVSFLLHFQNEVSDCSGVRSTDVRWAFLLSLFSLPPYPVVVLRRL